MVQNVPHFPQISRYIVTISDRKVTILNMLKIFYYNVVTFSKNYNIMKTLDTTSNILELFVPMRSLFNTRIYWTLGFVWFDVPFSTKMNDR